jgi:hypothetical protein
MCQDTQPLEGTNSINMIVVNKTEKLINGDSPVPVLLQASAFIIEIKCPWINILKFDVRCSDSYVKGVLLANASITLA